MQDWLSSAEAGAGAKDRAKSVSAEAMRIFIVVPYDESLFGQSRPALYDAQGGQKVQSARERRRTIG
jgi:hypothetical protein